MANFVFNIAKGRVAEYYNRVKTNDPTNAALIVVALATTGLESDATLKDMDTLAAVVAGATNEVTNTGYARITLIDSDLNAVAADDATDSMKLDFADLAFGAITAGDGWSKLLICYDSDTTGGTDANIVPLTAHDITVVPDGNTITIQIHASGFYEAS